jgi:hypothetical protein
MVSVSRMRTSLERRTTGPSDPLKATVQVETFDDYAVARAKVVFF